MKYRTSNCSAIQLKQLAQRQRVVRMLFLILIGFFICYLPFTIVILVLNKLVAGNTINSVSRHSRPIWIYIFCNFDCELVKIPDWLRSLAYVSRYIMCVNTAINPIIYGFCNDNFRKAAKKKFPFLKLGVKPMVETIASTSNVNTAPTFK